MQRLQIIELAMKLTLQQNECSMIQGFPARGTYVVAFAQGKMIAGQWIGTQDNLDDCQEWFRSTFPETQHLMIADYDGSMFNILWVEAPPKM